MNPRRPWLPPWFWYLVAAGAAAATVLGLGLSAALVLRGDTFGTKPVLVTARGSGDLPVRNGLVDRIGLYGVLPPGRTPADLDLGCDVHDIEGVGRGEAVPDVTGLRPLRIHGRTLQPLGTVEEGGFLESMDCSGPDLAAVSPLYVVGTWDLLQRGRRVVAALLGAAVVVTSAVTVLAVLRGRQTARRRRTGPAGPAPAVP